MLNDRITRSSIIKKAFLVLFFCVFFLILSFSLWRIYQKKYQQNEINQEIQKLQSEIEKLESENKDLGELLSYLETIDFKEKEIKDKLNLIKEGEEVVIIKEQKESTENQDNQQKKESFGQTKVIIHHPNYYLWWHLFFGIKEDI